MHVSLLGPLCVAILHQGHELIVENPFKYLVMPTVMEV